MANLEHSESVVIARPVEDVYHLVSDITRMGEFSPECKSCWWDEGAGPKVGAWFTGRNEASSYTWETRSEVIAAEPGREFAFIVGGNLVRWGYTFESVDGGTRLTESWTFLPDGITMFEDRFGEKAAAQIEGRRQAAHAGIPATLDAIKRTAEAG
jgi:hypothetical protein